MSFKVRKRLTNPQPDYHQTPSRSATTPPLPSSLLPPHPSLPPSVGVASVKTAAAEQSLLQSGKDYTELGRQKEKMWDQQMGITLCCPDTRAVRGGGEGGSGGGV